MVITKPKKLIPTVRRLNMKRIAIVYSFAVFLFAGFLFTTNTFAQKKSSVLSFEKAMTRLNDIPAYLGNYRAQRNIMLDRYNVALKYFGSMDQERAKMAMNNLVEAYQNVKQARSKADDLWLVYYLSGWDSEGLLEAGWTKEQVDTASPIIKKKMGDLVKDIVKINKAYPTINQVENLLIKMNVDIMEIIAGVNPAFIFGY